MYLYDIQGAKGWYQFNFTYYGDISVFDIITNEIIDSLKIIVKDGTIKSRIKTEKVYRYFTQKDIDGYLIRKKIAEMPIERLHFRSNVEATILQLGYHYIEVKSRHRNEIKHQM